MVSQSISRAAKKYPGFPPPQDNRAKCVSRSRIAWFDVDSVSKIHFARTNDIKLKHMRLSEVMLNQVSIAYNAVVTMNIDTLLALRHGGRFRH